MTATVYGSITDAATGTLLTNATASAPPYVVSHNNGVYWFVTPGTSTVAVTASAPDYVPQTVTVTVANGQIKHLPFALNHV